MTKITDPTTHSNPQDDTWKRIHGLMSHIIMIVSRLSHDSGLQYWSHTLEKMVAVGGILMTYSDSKRYQRDLRGE